MQPDEVRSLLRAYRENKARAVYLEAEAEEIRRGILEAAKPSLQGKSYEYTPPPSFASSPTEKLALMLVDGIQTETVRRWADELKSINQELRKTRMDAARVDAWLLGLTDKERVVITAHELDRLPWFKVAFQSEKLLGNYMTADGLRRIGRQAFEKICMIAR